MTAPSDPVPRPGSSTTIGDALPSVAGLVALPCEFHGRLLPEKRREASEPACTVTCHGVSERGRLDICAELAGGRRRRITTADLLALCGFPHDFRFPPGASAEDHWRPLGNAVPPPMAEAWARSLAGALTT
jgi:site-specific DNA-cytosine methylase